MLAITAPLSSCLVTRTEEVRVPSPLTRPVIQDVQGFTTPRLGALLEIDQGEDLTTLEFRVPVDDDGVDDPMQFQFFVNEDRDCVPRDGGASCEPTRRLGEVPANGMRRRLITRTITFTETGCNRVELLVASRIPQSGNFRTPERADDSDFRTWWIFVRPRTSTPTDGGVVDPVEACRFLVQP